MLRTSFATYNELVTIFNSTMTIRRLRGLDPGTHKTFGASIPRWLLYKKVHSIYIDILDVIMNNFPSILMKLILMEQPNLTLISCGE